MIVQRHFDLDGLPLAVSWSGDDLGRVLDRLLGAYAAAPAPSALHIHVERRAAAPHAPAEPSRFHFPPMRAWARPGGWLLVDDVAELVVRPEAGTIEGWLAADAPMALVSRFAGLTLWVALMECLRARGRYPLHGAALVAPTGETVLLSGTKGAGKSTATLALLEAGWAVLTDDTLFLERDAAGAVSLIGYRKRFHVRPDLLERRPDLAPLAHALEPWEPQDKRWLALDARFADRLRTRAAAPARLYFPSIAPQPRTVVTPLSRREALLRLLADSSFVFVRDEPAPGHLAGLRALADGAAAFTLAAGADLLADPTLYARLCGPAAGAEGAPWAPPSSASASS